LEKQNFNCCKELIARKKFDGNREACQDFEVVENKENPVCSIEDIRWTPLSRHEFAIFKIQLGLLF